MLGGNVKGPVAMGRDSAAGHKPKSTSATEMNEFMAKGESLVTLPDKLSVLQSQMW